jgi:hypothetical protein
MTFSLPHHVVAAANGAAPLETPAVHDRGSAHGRGYTEHEKELDARCMTQYYDTVIQDFAINSPRAFRGGGSYFERTTLEQLLLTQNQTDCNIVVNGAECIVHCLKNSRGLFSCTDQWIPVQEIQSLIDTGGFTEEQKMAIQREVEAYTERTPRRELFQSAISRQR